MSPSATLPASLDLSHHVTPRARAAVPSAMKALGKLLFDPTMLSLAGGLPHKTLFPMAAATYTVPSSESLAGGDVTDWTTGQTATETISFAKKGPGLFEDYEEGEQDLSEILQYGMTNGFSKTIEPLMELNNLVHGKPYSDASVYLTLGCTDGVSKTFLLFSEPGDNVLCEEFSFSSSLNSGRAKGINFFPVKMDGDGLIPEDLDKVMTTWDSETMGKRPHMLYTIPTGQNPTGSCPSEERYQAIYKLAQKHDLIIMEDDPYFPLQFKDYEPDKTKRDAQIARARAELPSLPEDKTQDDLYAVAKCYNDYAGVRSFYSRDVDGRVVRLDTFSKVFGPGLRLGWISCNSTFLDRFCRLGESSTQVPNNLSQSLIASILSPTHWGLGGWLRWCFAVRLEYQAKRDFFLDTLGRVCEEEFVTTVPARGGMFQWLQVHIEKHPRYVEHGPVPVSNGYKSTTVPPPHTNAGELMQKLWDACLKNKVLLLPGKLFAVQKMDGSANILDKTNYLRSTYAGNIPEIEKALEAFGKTIKEFFAVPGGDDSTTMTRAEAVTETAY